MNEVNVTFFHPTTDATLNAAINPSLTADEVIAGLVAENFISAPDSRHHYILAVNGGEKVEGRSTLESADVREGASVRVIDDAVAG